MAVPKAKRKKGKATYVAYVLKKHVCEDSRRIFWDWVPVELSKPKKRRGRRRRLVTNTFPKGGE